MKIIIISSRDWNNFKEQNLEKVNWQELNCKQFSCKIPQFILDFPLVLVAEDQECFETAISPSALVMKADKIENCSHNIKRSWIAEKENIAKPQSPVSWMKECQTEINIMIFANMMFCSVLVFIIIWLDGKGRVYIKAFLDLYLCLLVC